MGDFLRQGARIVEWHLRRQAIHLGPVRQAPHKCQVLRCQACQIRPLPPRQAHVRPHANNDAVGGVGIILKQIAGDGGRDCLVGDDSAKSDEGCPGGKVRRKSTMMRLGLHGRSWI